MAAQSQQSFFEKLGNLDRRIIYLVVGLCLLIPFFLKSIIPEKLKAQPVDQKTQDLFDVVEALGKANAGPGKDKIVVVDIMWDPSVQAECWPQTEAMLEHCLRLNIPVACVAFRPEGPGFVPKLIDVINERWVGLAKNLTKRDEPLPLPDFLRNRIDLEDPPWDYPKGHPKHEIIEYGTDYCNWGYYDPQMAVYLAMKKNLYSIVIKDVQGTPIRNVPMMRDISGLQDAGLVFQSTGSASYAGWIFYITPDLGLDFGFGCTAIMGPEMVPFYTSGQIVGMMDGMAGAAQYEYLLKEQARDNYVHQLKLSGKVGVKRTVINYDDPQGITGMMSQNMAHLWIILSVVLGNVGYFATKRRERRERGLL